MGNPACDRYATCEIEEFEYDKFKGINECMKHESYKRENRRLKQR